MMRQCLSHAASDDEERQNLFAHATAATTGARAANALESADSVEMTLVIVLTVPHPSRDRRRAGHRGCR